MDVGFLLLMSVFGYICQVRVVAHRVYDGEIGAENALMSSFHDSFVVCVVFLSCALTRIEAKCSGV